jgi:hypothetical protein
LFPALGDTMQKTYTFRSRYRQAVLEKFGRMLSCFCDLDLGLDKILDDDESGGLQVMSAFQQFMKVNENEISDKRMLRQFSDIQASSEMLVHKMQFGLRDDEGVLLFLCCVYIDDHGSCEEREADACDYVFHLDVFRDEAVRTGFPDLVPLLKDLEECGNVVINRLSEQNFTSLREAVDSLVEILGIESLDNNVFEFVARVVRVYKIEFTFRSIYDYSLAVFEPRKDLKMLKFIWFGVYGIPRVKILFEYKD